MHVDRRSHMLRIFCGDGQVIEIPIEHASVRSIRERMDEAM